MKMCTILVALALALGGAAAADDEKDPTGFEWDFGLDAIGAAFIGNDSYFGESQTIFGADTDDWLELGVEPKLSFRMPLGGGVAFGELSGIATYTGGDDASGLTVGIDAQGATLEQAHVGWRIGDPFGFMEGETFEVVLGNQDYRIGSGMIVADGGGDGAERGGWYLGMRKAFHESIMLRVRSDTTLLEAFSLKNHPRQGGVEGEAVGINAEHSFEGGLRLGGSYMDVDANIPGSDTLSVLSGRVDWVQESGFGFNGEYAIEDNDQIEADAYFAQFNYAANDLPWSPIFSYRYASFSGDDITTPTVDEGWRSIAYGYSDYGSWYQGEITGNYPLGNGSLQSNMLRMKASPADGYTLNVIYFQFAFNEPAALGLTSDDWGDELDVTLDVELSDSLYLIGVVGLLMPGDAAVQLTGGDSNWLYSMIYLSYTW